MSAKAARDDPWLTPEQLAERFQLDVKVINRWRREAGRGPDFVRVGKQVRYRESAVEAFEQRLEDEAAAERRRAS